MTGFAVDRRRRRSAGWTALASLAWPALAVAQSPPPPCSTAVKGRVVSVDAKGRTVTIDRGGSRRDVLPLAEPGLTAVRSLKAGDQVTLKLDCRVEPPPVVGVSAVSRSDAGPGPGPGPVQPSGPRGTTVLLATDAACALTVDFKPWGPLAAGARTELKLAPGEHMLEASTEDGRSWKEKVKVGSEQLIVEVKLGQPAATLAQYDAQAARVYGALEALKAAGRDLDAVLRDKKFRFHNADSAAVSAAVASWTRELTALRGLVPPPARGAVTEAMAAPDADAREYAELLVGALEKAQERNTVMGEASTLRAKAQAKLGLLSLPAETLALLQASPEFKQAQGPR